MEVRKLMIVHPSRGRVAMATEALRSILDTMTSGVPVTYYLSLDRDDPCAPAYMTLLQDVTGILVADNPHEVVQASNRACALLDDEDFIIANTDDYRFDQGWDQHLLDLLATLPDECLVWHPDYLNKDRLAAPQMLSRGLYRRLGYMFWPEYLSMYADADLYEAAHALGCDYPLRPMRFRHLHPAFGTRPMDETTKRTEAPEKHAQGRRVIEARRRRGFDL